MRFGMWNIRSLYKAGSLVTVWKLNSVAFSPQANYTERPPLVGEVSADRGRVVSATDSHGR
jgi:hypothetical protein